MNSKKLEARKEMLKRLSKSKSSEMHEPTIGESLKKKKLSKVTVIADDKKGLSKAQQILKAKLGEKLGLGEEEEESEEEMEECPACESKGCEECIDDEEEEDEE